MDDVLSDGEERKLITRPRCGVELKVECRWFGEERGCQVGRIEAPDIRTVLVLVGLLSAVELPVRVVLNSEVREEHVVLVGVRSPGD